MLNSLTACGSTLLDTINHVMDHAKISEPQKVVASRRIKNSNTIRLSSKPLRSTRSKDPAFDFGLATEEVVEAVFAGSSFIPNATAMLDPPATPSADMPDFFDKRKICYIILDVDFAADWIFSFPAGSWRRIVMSESRLTGLWHSNVVSLTIHNRFIWQCDEVYDIGLYSRVSACQHSASEYFCAFRNNTYC